MLAAALAHPSPRPATGFVIGYVTALLPALGTRLAPEAILGSIHGGLRLVLPKLDGRCASIDVENNGDIVVTIDAGAGPTRVPAKVGSVIQRLLEFYGRDHR